VEDGVWMIIHNYVKISLQVAKIQCVYYTFYQ